MGDEWRVSRMWSALGYQRWTNRDDPWVMSGEYQNVISPGCINDGQTEMTHGWWVESIRMWSALGYTMDKQRWPMMSGEYQNVISPGIQHGQTRWPMGDEWRVSECDQPWVTTMDKQRWPMGDEWRVSEHDQPWVTNDGQTEMTHGWWVESIRMWSALGIRYMINPH